MIDFRHATRAEIAREILRLLGIGAILFLMAVAETAVPVSGRLFSVFPELTLAYLCSYAWRKENALAGGICGIAAGLLHDGVTGVPIFVGPLLYFVTGYVLGQLAQKTRRHAPTFFLAVLLAEFVVLAVRAIGGMFLARYVNLLQVLAYELLPGIAVTYASSALLYLVYGRNKRKTPAAVEAARNMEEQKSSEWEEQ